MIYWITYLTGRDFDTTIKFNAPTGEEYFDLHLVPKSL